ncbi:MAG: sigma-70 family RNA polymerase sigma factor [Isosphaeraceae bacterium]
MAIGRRADVIRGFRAIFEGGLSAGLSDGELLDRAISGPGPTAELAFEALVERHGPMVLRACRQVLGDPHDAHDAFQSTFLVLARKAGAIREKDSVASWLHGVALRVASSSRADLARRRKHERIRAGFAPSWYSPRDPEDLGAVIHEEIGRLPGRYREAAVLCYLEGKSHEEAAGLMRCPVGTVKSRLAGARERLRGRLVRRGFAPASGAVATLLAAESASAAAPLPAFWVETTSEAALRFAAGSWAAGLAGTVPGQAAALANGVLRTMILNQLKVAVVTGGALLAAAGLGLTPPQSAPAAPAAAAAGFPGQAQAQGEPDRLKSLEAKLDRLISAMEGKQAAPVAVAQPAGTVTTYVPGVPAISQPATAVTTYAPAGVPIEVSTTGQGIARATAPRAVATNRSTGQLDRFNALEDKLAALEKRIEALEKAAKASAPANPGAMLPAGGAASALRYYGTVRDAGTRYRDVHDGGAASADDQVATPARP